MHHFKGRLTQLKEENLEVMWNVKGSNAGF